MYKNWQVNLVINYDLPMKYGTSEPDCEVYLHRIGRAGRFGRKGKQSFLNFLFWKFLSFCFFTRTIFLEIGAVFNLICTDRDQMIMEKIERHFEHYIPEVLIMLSNLLSVLVP